MGRERPTITASTSNLNPSGSTPTKVAPTLLLSNVSGLLAQAAIVGAWRLPSTSVYSPLRRPAASGLEFCLHGCFAVLARVALGENRSSLGAVSPSKRGWSG